jgi:hypothetical protein
MTPFEADSYLPDDFETINYPKLDSAVSKKKFS